MYNTSDINVTQVSFHLIDFLQIAIHLAHSDNMHYINFFMSIILLLFTIHTFIQYLLSNKICVIIAFYH